MQPIAQPEKMQIDGEYVGKTKCHIHRLPTELFQIVIDYLSEDGIASTKKNLLSLCRSSKPLSAQAKWRLYKFNADWVSTGKEELACLPWAISSDRKDTVESVMNFTPEVCELRHLYEAILLKKFEIAWIMLKQKTVHIKLKTMKQDSPIFEAVEVGHTELVDYIIEIQGLDVSMFDRYAKTVLHHACENGHLNLVERFLGENANPHAIAEWEHAITPIMSAIKCDIPEARYRILDRLLAPRPGLKHECSNQEYEEYMKRIARKCNLDDLQCFLKVRFFKTFLNDPPPNIQRERWLYWLEQAKHFKNTEIFRKVFELCPPEHHTDVLFAKVFDMIRPWGGLGKGEVMILIGHFQSRAITEFWPEARNSLGKAMLCTIQKDDVYLMESLLHFYGLVVKSPGFGGSFQSSLKGRLTQPELPVPHSSEMLKLLLCHGFDVNYVGYSRDGLTALQRAIEQVQLYDTGIEVIKDLIPMVDNIDEVGFTGRTALHQCVNMRAPQPQTVLDKVIEIAKILINNGADLSARDDDGDTPLHLAVSSRLLDPFVHLFLDRGADKTVENIRGQPPLWVLRTCERNPTKEVVDRLL